MLFALVASSGALQLGSSVNRRNAVMAGVASFTLPPLAAHADTIDDIAARSNAAAERAAIAKAEAAKPDFFASAASSVGNFVLTGAVLGLVGASGVFLFQAKTEADKTDASVFTKDPGGNTPEGYKSNIDMED